MLGVMGPDQQFYASVMFENRVLKATGFEYENLFHQVMTLRHPGEFIPIEPYGNLGDRKNDGYIPSKGEFFQVYAPKKPSEKLGKAAKKAESDFAELYQFWQKKCPIQHYRFVFKDDFTGSIAPLEVALLAIASKHKIKAGPFLSSHLMSETLALSDGEVFKVLNSIVPYPGFLPDADYAAVRDIVNHVLGSSQKVTEAGTLATPTLVDKIQFNKLSPEVGLMLLNGARQINVVNDFFAGRAGFHRQLLRDHLAKIYSEEKKLMSKRGKWADRLFFRILDRITPPSRHMEKAVQDAALVVMSFYFEACDVFESPNAAT
jgi:hypothetical protein